MARFYDNRANTGKSRIARVPRESLIFDGDDDVDEHYLTTRYNLDLSRAGGDAYDVSGETKDVERFFKDFNLRGDRLKIEPLGKGRK